MGILVPPDGPVPAKIMIVGEAPGEEEERRLIPFVGSSGIELNRMLQEAGISRSECFVTNLARERPPRNDISLWLRDSLKFTSKPTKADEKRRAVGIEPRNFVRMRDRLVDPRVLSGYELLQKEISLVNPNIIIPVGNAPMWALTNRWGITKWRGSMLSESIGGAERRLIPTFHPAAILRQWNWRAISVNDFCRAARYRNGSPYPTAIYNFIIRPSFDQAANTLQSLIHRADACTGTAGLRISFDLETRAGHIACAGISWTYRDGICIPLMCTERRSGYWELEQEIQIVQLLARLLTHPNVRVVGQNLLYDSQYTYRWWHFVPRVDQDAMISQHSIFSELPKSLAFQASMYCDWYVFWKDEGKDWAKSMNEEELWYYNCEDCTYTAEVADVELKTVEKLGLQDVHKFQQSMFWPVLRAMQLGVRIDTRRRDELITEVQAEIDRRHNFLTAVLGHPLNPDSPKQMHALFYNDFKMPVQLKRGKPGEPSRPTLDDDALQKLARIEPLLRPLVNSIADIRTLGKFLSNFLCRALDVDQRMRCAFNIGGSESGESAPKTYRLSSSENAFGSGTNLQNIPSEKSKSVGRADRRAKQGVLDGIGDPYKFPNIREIFIPDTGFTWFDLDLERADLFVFVWEIDDAVYKDVLIRRVDAHLFHSYLLDNKEPPPLDELVEQHAEDETCTCPGRCYWEHRVPRKHKREFAKSFCHAVDYVGGSVTIAKSLGLSVNEVDRSRRTYLGIHPKIEPYWKTVEHQIKTYRFVQNKFGYRWYIFGRLDLPEAVAWIPQSTVSVVINKIWERLYREMPEVQVLMQVHDSLPGQFPTSLKDTVLPKLRECAKIVVPYPDPLVIPVSIKTSEKSWGHC